MFTDLMNQHLPLVQYLDFFLRIAAACLCGAGIGMERSHRLKEAGLQAQMIMQVHDELNFNVVPGEEEKVQNIVIEEMQKAWPMSVPLIADCGWGNNWLEAH